MTTAEDFEIRIYKDGPSNTNEDIAVEKSKTLYSLAKVCSYLTDMH